MGDRLDEIIDRLRDLDHRLSRVERGAEERTEHGAHGGPRMEHGCPRCRAPGYEHHRDPHHHEHRDHHHEHRDHHHEHRDHCDRDHRSGGGDFDEKRVIDTIVRLVCENLAPRVQQIVARELDRRAPGSDRQGDPGAR